MPTPTTRRATAQWEGSLADGKGNVDLESSGVGSFEVTWPSRSEQPQGRTSPEEMLAAAHATCFSMALSHALTQAGTPPQIIRTSAEVGFQAGTGITGITLTCTATVPGIASEQFEAVAQDAKATCPVSQALSTPITLQATLNQ